MPNNLFTIYMLTLKQLISLSAPYYIISSVILYAEMLNEPEQHTYDDDCVDDDIDENRACGWKRSTKYDQWIERDEQ